MKHADECLHSYGNTARMSADPILRIAKCGIVGVLSKLVNYLPLPLLGLRFSPNHKTWAPSRTEARGAIGSEKGM